MWYDAFLWQDLVEEEMAKSSGWPRREGSFELPSFRLHYAVWGPKEGRPLVLLHGGAANSHWWDWLGPRLANSYRLLALDFPGHGQSEWPCPSQYTMKNLVRAVLDLGKALETGPLHLVGHSLGGKVAMLTAARHPRQVRTLTVVDAAPDISADGLAEIRRIGTRPLRRFASRSAAARAFRLIPGETVAPAGRLQSLAVHCTRHRGHGRWSIGPDREFLSRIVPLVAWSLLPTITCPTLILRAERSSILSRRTASAMRRAIPHSILREIPGTHHHLILERPAAVAAAIRAFLTASASL